MTEILRLPAEKTFGAELDALQSADTGPKPGGWAMSPRAAVTYLMGAKAADGTPISAKYVGDKRLIETAVRGEEEKRPQATKILEAMLNRVALLVDAAAAAELTTLLTASDLRAADPKLDLLHLNAALAPETTL